ncbi:MAG: chemotaxis protein CheB [Nannocystaceae bacterium]
MQNKGIDRDTLLTLADLLERETGISLQGLRDELVRARLARRLRVLGIESVRDYATRLEVDSAEMPHFINLMTTNHTYFFREIAHLDFLQNVFLPRFYADGPRPLNLWCAACSTGEEPYTVAMLVDRFLHDQKVTSAVTIMASDINTEALRTAKNGVYPASRLGNLPREIKSEYLRQGRFPHDGFFRVNDHIRKMVRFSPLNLVSPVKLFRRFDLVFCRNVLIYFEPQTVRQVVRFLCDMLQEDGAFITGLSEQVERHDPRLCPLGRSIYTFREDSRYAHQRWEAKSVATTAPPRARPRTVPAPERRSDSKPLSVSRPRHSPVATARSHPHTSLIAIGASTGGIDALQRVVRELRTDGPSVLIAQHIPPKYSSSLADTLAHMTRLEAIEAVDGSALRSGHIYVSPGGRHLTVRSRGGRLVCVVRDAPQRRFRPSVDLLFESLAALNQVHIVAAILTGMGNDGTSGAIALRERGHYVIAQDEETSLVYGMPGSAAAADAVDIQLPLNAIGRSLANRAERGRRSIAA